MGLGLGCGISPRFRNSTHCEGGEVGSPGVGRGEGSFIPLHCWGFAPDGGEFSLVGVLGSFPWVKPPSSVGKGGSGMG